MMEGVTWKEAEGQLQAVHENPEIRIAWAPQPGAQECFLECPSWEVLGEGNRGGGKTIVLLIDFAREVGKGYGMAWEGLLLRKTFPQLRDTIKKSMQVFPMVWPEAKYNRGDHAWYWPTGECLRFSYMEQEDDYWNYHGHEYPWIGWEEITTWGDDLCYKVMMTLNRAAIRGMPRRYRATTNSYGPGHNWVKHRFQLPIQEGHLFKDCTNIESKETDRSVVHFQLSENKILLTADPGYRARIVEGARNPQELKAWLHGSWDIVAGGMFDDVWDPAVHVVPQFVVPSTWRLDRSFDWGSSKPFSVGWWAESDGSDVTFNNGTRMSTLKGDLFRVHEYYGWSGKPNEGLRMTAKEVARNIKQQETDLFPGRKPLAGPADSSIFDTANGMNQSISAEMKSVGISWTKADKGPGSRINGWERLRSLLKGSIGEPGLPREENGLFIVETCDQFLRTFPVLPRDTKKIDDVDTKAEDHVGDEVRYRCYRKVGGFSVVRVTGR